MEVDSHIGLCLFFSAALLKRNLQYDPHLYACSLCDEWTDCGCANSHWSSSSWSTGNLPIPILQPQHDVTDFLCLKNHWFTYDEKMSVESVTQSVSNLALAFGDDDHDASAMVREFRTHGCVTYQYVFNKWLSHRADLLELPSCSPDSTKTDLSCFISTLLEHSFSTTQRRSVRLVKALSKRYRKSFTK